MSTNFHDRDAHWLFTDISWSSIWLFFWGSLNLKSIRRNWNVLAHCRASLPGLLLVSNVKNTKQKYVLLTLFIVMTLLSYFTFNWCHATLLRSLGNEICLNCDGGWQLHPQVEKHSETTVDQMRPGRWRWTVAKLSGSVLVIKLTAWHNDYKTFRKLLCLIIWSTVVRQRMAS